MRGSAVPIQLGKTVFLNAMHKTDRLDVLMQHLEEETMESRDTNGSGIDGPGSDCGCRQYRVGLRGCKGIVA
jgi:hypothetical protein